MSSTVCRCFDGAACPSVSAGANGFFEHITLDEFSRAVYEAVSDYVRLRGLRGLCPSLDQWGPPPSPAAFLDSGLPEPGGSGSLALGLSGGPKELPSGLPSWCNPCAIRGREIQCNRVFPDTWHAEEFDGSPTTIISSGKDKMSGTTRNQLARPAIWGREREGGVALPVFGTEPRYAALGGCGRDATSTDPRSIEAKKLLRSLREGREDRRRQGYRHHGGRLCSGKSSGAVLRPFVTPDAWDDTGIFTDAPRPKSVPHHVVDRQAHARMARVRGRSTSPVVSSAPARDQNLRSELHAGGDGLGSGRWRGEVFGFGDWMQRRREHGGGGGDVTVEFLDVREAALVGVSEALARRALPWQAQLCPRALQDLDIIRVKTYHEKDRASRAASAAGRSSMLRELLARERRDWDVFNTTQREEFEDALGKMRISAEEWQRVHVHDFRARQERSAMRIREAKGCQRYETNRFEQRELEALWFHRRAIFADLMWDPSSTMEAVNAEQERRESAEACWEHALKLHAMHEDSFAWLEAAGVRAIAAEAVARWERGITGFKGKEEARAAERRETEGGRSKQSYQEMVGAVLEGDTEARSLSSAAWNLQGWLSVGMHKLVQQTLRSRVRSCNHPYSVCGVLWEARQAAEFAASARAAAACQRASDAREIANTRRSQTSMVREHKRRMFEADRKRAAAEEAERSQGMQLLMSRVVECATATEEEANAQYLRERAHTDLERKHEAGVVQALRGERSELARELDQELKRIALSLEESRKDEEHHVNSEVSLARVSLQEQVAKAEACETWLRETMLKGSEEEDSLLLEWIVNRGSKTKDALEDRVAEAQRVFAEGRKRWMEDVSIAVSKIVELDVSLVRGTGRWEEVVTSAHEVAEEGEKRCELVEDVRSCFHRANAYTWGNYNGWTKRFTVEGGELLLEDSHAEVRAAEARASRLDAFENLVRKAQGALWGDFWRELLERERIAGVARDMIATRWTERQIESAEGFWARWREQVRRPRAVKEDAAAGAGVEGVPLHADDGSPESSGLMSDASLAHEAEGETAEGRGGSSQDHRQAEFERMGASIRQGSGTAVSSTGGFTKLQDSPQGISGEDNPSLENRRYEEGDPNSRDTRLESSNKEPGAARYDELGRQSLESVEARGDGRYPIRDLVDVTFTSSSLIVPVGHKLAVHFSTLPELSAEDTTHIEALKYRSEHPTDSLSQTLACGPDPDQVDVVDQCEEVEWTRALKDALADNDVMDLAELGAAVGAKPGGVVVLCLAYDSIVEDGELEGMVRLEHVLRATEAFAMTRWRMRTCSRWGRRGQRGASATTEELPGTQTGTEKCNVAVESCSRSLDLEDLNGVAIVEAALEFEVIGGRVSAELTEIFSRPGGDQMERRRQVSSLRRALRSQEPLVSPQSVCALTALLSAHALTARSSRDGTSDSDCSLTVRQSAWRLALAGALITVRRVSLEHSVLWAASCSIPRLLSALSVGRDDAPPSPVCGQSDRTTIDGVQGLRLALQHASGLGLSSLVLLSATAGDDIENSDREQNSQGDQVTDPHDAVLALISILSPENYANICCCLRDPETGPETDPGTELGSDPGMDPETEPRTDPDTEPRTDPETDPNTDPSIKPETEPKTEHKADPEAGMPWTQMDRVIDSKVASTFRCSGELRSKDVSDGSKRPSFVNTAKDIPDDLMEEGIDKEAVSDTANPGVSAGMCVQENSEPGLVLDTDEAHAVLDLAECHEWRSFLSGVGGTQGGQSRPEVVEAVPGEEEKDRPMGCASRASVDCSGQPLSCNNATVLSRLMRAAKKLRLAVPTVVQPSRVVSADREVMVMDDRTPLEKTRETRRRLAVEKGRTAVMHALESIQHRHACIRRERRAQLLEEPRLQAMRRSVQLAHRATAAAASMRLANDKRRGKIRASFISALQNRFGAESLVFRAMPEASATAELWLTMNRIMMQGWDSLMATVRHLGSTLQEATKALDEFGLQRLNGDLKARGWFDRYPEWWGEEAVALDVEASLRQEVLRGRQGEGGVTESKVQLIQEVSRGMEEYSRCCRETLSEIEKKLESTSTEFQGRRDRARSARFSSHEEADTPERACTSKGHSHSDSIALYRESLAWLTEATEILKGQCADVEVRAAELVKRTEKRLSRVVERVTVETAQVRSVLARGLQEVSISWRREIPQRRDRWNELYFSRRASYEEDLRTMGASVEQSGSAGADATAARGACLEETRESVGKVIAAFTDSVLLGSDLKTAQALGSKLAELAEAQKEVMSTTSSFADAAGCSDADDDAGVIEVVREIIQEDNEIKARNCEALVEGWWRAQLEAAWESLGRRESQLEEQGIRQEVNRLISGSLVTGVEVRHDADMLSKRLLDHLAAESQRVVELAAAADRALIEEVTTAAEEAHAAAEREMGVLSLEAQALSVRVSSALQEKLDGAGEDLLEAERRQNHRNLRGGDSAGKEDGSDDVTSDGSAQPQQPES